MNIKDNKKLKLVVEESGILDKKTLNDLYTEAEERGVSLERLLKDNGYLSDEEIGQLIALHLNLPFVVLKRRTIPEHVLSLIPEEISTKQKVIAFEVDKNSIKLASPHPLNENFFSILQKELGKEIILYYITESDYKMTYTKHGHGLVQKKFEKLIKDSVSQAEIESSSESPIIEIVQLILTFAYENDVSDIHIEPMEKQLIVRFRIDGILYDLIQIPKNIEERILSRIKVLAKLRTDEHKTVQEGRFKYSILGETIDVRTSIIPMAWGEKCVMRLLYKKNKSDQLEDLGFSKSDLSKIMKIIRKPKGMILATGPTGSGKTTTLYSIIKILNSRKVNISTIEDPIEYTIDGINQIQVDPRSDIVFANGLKSLLRQDPDIIMVGEIRDEETAQIAISAAMTGHLVLSTLHTNNASTTLPRLIDMGVKPYMVASTIDAIIAQRLVRRICPKCIRSRNLTKDEQELYADIMKEHTSVSNPADLVVYEGAGCEACNQTGYSGRLGIFEVMLITDKIKKLIIQGKSADEIEQEAIKEGMVTLFQDGIEKVLRGLTTLEEVIRVSEL